MRNFKFCTFIGFSLPCHLRRTNKSAKFEIVKPFCFMFRISKWTCFHQNAQYTEGIFVIRPENILFCRHVHAHFSLEILQDVTFKGLKSVSFSRACRRPPQLPHHPPSAPGSCPPRHSRENWPWLWRSRKSNKRWKSKNVHGWSELSLSLCAVLCVPYAGEAYFGNKCMFHQVNKHIW